LKKKNEQLNIIGKSIVKKPKTERLKPISFHGLKPEDVIRAFLQTDPEKLKEAEKPKFRIKEIDKEEK
jgi:hypothetical protein